jgi:hypothetical protein
MAWSTRNWGKVSILPRELDTGATRANSKVADFLFYGICGGTGKPAFKDERARVTAAIFWMKTRGGWSETSTHKHTRCGER